MQKKLPYDDPRAVQSALTARPGGGIIVPGKGVVDDVVRHVCPECGGKFSPNPARVALCPACHGVGELTNAQLEAHLSHLQAEARDEERRNGTR